MTPDVPTSRRWTMPCRSVGPSEATLYPAARSPPMTVGPSQPTLGCAATPTGLCTQMISASLYKTSMPSTSSSRGSRGFSGSGSSTETTWPDARRSDLPSSCESTVTPPSAHSWAVAERERPRSLASAASARMPSKPSGMGKLRNCLFIFRPPFRN